MTQQRQLILDILRRAPRHLTAEEIFDEARSQMPSIALGTVYRNLGLLTESGEIRRLEVPGASARYDRAAAPHPHFICTTCGTIRDIATHNALLDEFSQKFSLPLSGYDLNLYGLCDGCAALTK